MPLNERLCHIYLLFRINMLAICGLSIVFYIYQSMAFGTYRLVLIILQTNVLEFAIVRCHVSFANYISFSSNIYDMHQ